MNISDKRVGMEPVISFDALVRSLRKKVRVGRFETVCKTRELHQFLVSFCWAANTVTIHSSDSVWWTIIGLLETVMRKRWAVFTDCTIVYNLNVFDALALHMKKCSDANRKSCVRSMENAFDLFTNCLLHRTRPNALVYDNRFTIEKAIEMFKASTFFTAEAAE